MGIEVYGELSAKLESVFGVTPTGSYQYHRVLRDTLDITGLKFDGEAVPDESLVTSWHQRHDHKRGTQHGSAVSGTVYVEGLTTPLDASGTYTSPNNSCIQIFKAAFGASDGGIGSTVTAGASTTVNSIEVGAAHGTRFKVGGAFAVVTTAGIQARRIRKIVGDVVHPHMAFASVPSGGSAVYNSETVYLDETGVGGDNNSMFLRLLRYGAQEQYFMRGAVPTLTIEAAMRETVKAAVNWNVATCSRVTGETIGAGSPVGRGHLPYNYGAIQYGTTTDTDTVIAYNLLEAEGWNIDPGLTLADEQSPSGVETMRRYRPTPAMPKIGLTFRAIASNTVFASFFTERASDTKKFFSMQIGNTVGTGGTGMILIHAPRCQFDMWVKPSKAGGFNTAELALEPTFDRNFTGGTLAMAQNKFSVSFF